MVKGQAWEQHLYPLPITEVADKWRRCCTHARAAITLYRAMAPPIWIQNWWIRVVVLDSMQASLTSLIASPERRPVASTMNATKRMNVSTSSPRMGWYRLFFCSERTWKAADDPGKAGRRVPDARVNDRLGAVGKSSTQDWRRQHQYTGAQIRWWCLHRRECPRRSVRWYGSCDSAERSIAHRWSWNEVDICPACPTAWGRQGNTSAADLTDHQE